MKLDDAVIITKGACALTRGMLIPLGAGLSQWVNSGDWPSTLVWIVVIAGCLIGGANSLSDFLSQAFGNYKAQSRADTARVDMAPKPPAP